MPVKELNRYGCSSSPLANSLALDYDVLWRIIFSIYNNIICRQPSNVWIAMFVDMGSRLKYVLSGDIFSNHLPPPT